MTAFQGGGNAGVTPSPGGRRDRSVRRSPEAKLVEEIVQELARARAKFPGDNVTMLALMEEVGELAKASFEEPRVNVRKEAIQVACMAMRVVLDGDVTLNAWRESKGLDALTEPRLDCDGAAGS